MAKRIKLTADVIDDARQAFEKRLSAAKISDGKFTFSFDLTSFDRKATVYFTEKAWLRMNLLVQKLDSEIGWHGIACRADDPESDEYIVSDILVYPQIVTGATVDTDNEKLREWMNEVGAETFQQISFQGHSHVDFGAAPSGTDKDLYQKFLSQLPKDRFYIFMILNKRGEMWIEIYDMLKNVHFESKDVDAKLLESDIMPKSFFDDAVSKLSKPTPTYTTPTYAGSTYGKNYGYGYGGYGSGYYPPYTPPKGTAVYSAENPKKTEDKKDKQDNDKKGKPKKFRDSYYADDYGWYDGRY